MSFFQNNSDVHVVSLAKWLDYAGGMNNEIFVALPMIQRGSVWQPHQIIDLWDSLLQGMPIGSMMVSKLEQGIPVRRPGRSQREEVPAGGGLGLIDGHQRTLAMLIAWQRAGGVEMDRRVWVDFADEPAPGQLLRLRVTTQNQPFGFQRNEPSRKLSLNERRNAREAFVALHGEQGDVFSAEKDRKKPDYWATATPFSYDPGLPIDLKWLISLWRQRREPWRDEVMGKLKHIESATFSAKKWQKVKVWETLNEKEKTEVDDRVAKFADALSRLFHLEMPLIRVDEGFFEPQGTDNSDPPLAVLFKRIGTGGTPLSDADYVYSVIKHLRPEAYDLVENLHHKQNVASLLMAADLVMSAVRLAAVTWQPADGKPVPDMENPSKQDFHRLLQRGDFIDKKFLPLIQGEEAEIARYFNDVQATLAYPPQSAPGESNEEDKCDIGLPKQAFPLLKRPLVQVLLRLAQVGYLNSKEDKMHRSDVLRLVMFWLVAVTDPSKASRLAYEIIKEKHGSSVALGRAIHDRLVEDSAAVRLPAPEDIKVRPGLAFSSENADKLLRGESRFDAKQKGDDTYQTVYTFYRNHWWRPWTYQHPILLWLQREMVADKLDREADPMAGRDEDTPYDYDHILPYAHWGNWTGVTPGTTRLLDFAERQIWVVGNSIGNVRVWGSSLNRSDGDAPPTAKLMLDVDDNKRSELLKDSAVCRSQIENWKLASGPADQPRIWSGDRALAFQRAVEERTFDLYQRYFTDLGFSEWCGGATG